LVYLFIHFAYLYFEPAFLIPINERQQPNRLHQSLGCGRIAFHDLFLEALPDTSVESMTVLRTETVRQSGDLGFADVIQRMRDGQVDRNASNLLLGRTLGRLPPAERAEFEREALYIMPTWKRTIPITNKYLKELQTPVLNINYDYPQNHCNHAAEEIHFPARSALAVDAKVMLLSNYVVHIIKLEPFLFYYLISLLFY
jgi:hypothetical protein